MSEDKTIEQKQYSLKDIAIFKRIYRFFKPYLRVFILILLLDLFVIACFNLEPLIAKGMIDFLSSVERGNDVKESMKIITFYICLDMGAWFFAGLGGYFVSLKLKKLGQRVIKDMRDEMFDHILSLSQKQLRQLKIGSYVTRVTNDTQNLSTLFSDILPQFLRAFLSLCIIIVTTFIVTSKEGVSYFGLLYLAYLPIVFFLSYLFRKKAKKYYRKEKKSISEMNSFLSENFQGIKVIKTYDREEKKVQEFKKKNEDIYSSFLHSQRLFAFFYPFMYLLQISCVILVIAIAIPNIRLKAMTTGIKIGTFQMLYSYSTQFFQPIQQITNLLNQIESIITSAERIEIVLQQEIEIEDKEGAIDVPEFKGKIEFRHVSFAYEKGHDVLHDVSFVINPGQSAAFVGATGAGKSTIISLISRTYEITSGAILIDDINIEEYSLTCLRRNIGVMLQDVFLFSGTITDNITLGDEKVKEDDVIKDCKEVGADTFISRLPEGYMTPVKEKGANFSAGERQLISFARTLVYSPSMVLLDEATANIDTETENIIQTSLEKMKKIGTMLIVAHRLSTIKDCDIIFVVDKGVIKESGNHQQLLQNHGLYYNLYRLQNMERNLGN